MSSRARGTEIATGYGSSKAQTDIPAHAILTRTQEKPEKNATAPVFPGPKLEWGGIRTLASEETRT